jgi:tetratricopeptide (TPR) repeat protein
MEQLLTKPRSPDELAEAQRLLELGLQAYDLYQTTGDVADLDRAVKNMRRSVELAPGRTDFLKRLAYVLSTRFDAGGAVSDFEESLEIYLAVLRGTMNPTEVITSTCLLVQSYLEGWLALRRYEYLEEGIRLARRAVDTCHDPSLEAFCLQTLYYGLSFRANETNSLEDREQAIRVIRQLVQANDGKVPKHLELLRKDLGDYFTDTGDVAVLEEIVQVSEAIIDLAPDDDPEMPDKLLSLSLYLYDWSLAAKVPHALEESLTRKKQAIRLAKTSGDSILDLRHPIRLTKLGASLYQWYERTNTSSDLAYAIRLTRMAIDLTPRGNLNLVDRLLKYGQYLLGWSEKIGTREQLEEGIEVVRQLIDLASHELLEEGKVMISYSRLLRNFYLKTGKLDYLEEAVRVIRGAVAVVPEDHPRLVDLLVQLSLQLFARYTHTRTISDLQASIRAAREAANLTKPGHPQHVKILTLSSQGLAELATRENPQGNGTEAIGIARQAVDVASSAYERTQALQQLASTLSMVFGKTNYLALLDEAIEVMKGLVESDNVEGLMKAYFLQSLANYLWKRHLQLQSSDDLDEAILRLRQAVELGGTDDFDAFTVSSELGEYLTEREFKRATAGEGGMDFEEVEDLLLAGFNRSNIGFSEAMVNGRPLLDLYMSTKRWQSALDVADRMLDLVPSMAPRPFQIVDRQHVLRFASGIASDAATAAVRLGKDAFFVLNRLEKGRGVLGTSLEELRRTDLSDLQQARPELMERFVRLRSQLERPVNEDAQRHVLDGQSSADERTRIGTEFEEVIAEISTVPGFETFFSAPSEKDLLTAASSGPIVFINANKHSCDAVILERHQARTMPLEDLRWHDIQEKISQGQLGKLSVLEWLWDTTMKPLLDTLGFEQPVSDGTWPHIWWIPTGVLSRFPLHAAGYHTKQRGETVMDRAISSYGSSVKAIIYGRRRSREASSSGGAKALLINMENTPHRSPLPFAGREVAILHGLCNSMKLTIHDSSRTKKSVMEELPDCTIFHFAGHGYTDKYNPSDSSLQLQDGPSAPLKVADLLALNLYARPPFLAYLSACGTGRMKDDKLLDESIHLMSACQLSGFRHVIGSLWEVNDETCVDMARITYEEMRDGEMSDGSVAFGLHRATRTLRDRWVSESEQVWGSREESRAVKPSVEERLVPDDTSAEGFGDDNDQNTTWESMVHDRGDRSLRDVFAAVEDDDDDSLPLPLWTPYVHFGV